MYHIRKHTALPVRTRFLLHFRLHVRKRHSGPEQMEQADGQQCTSVLLPGFRGTQVQRKRCPGSYSVKLRYTPHPPAFSLRKDPQTPRVCCFYNDTLLRNNSLLLLYYPLQIRLLLSHIFTDDLLHPDHVIPTTELESTPMEFSNYKTQSISIGLQIPFVLLPCTQIIQGCLLR